MFVSCESKDGVPLVCLIFGLIVQGVGVSMREGVKKQANKHGQVSDEAQDGAAAHAERYYSGTFFYLKRRHAGMHTPIDSTTHFLASAQTLPTALRHIVLRAIG